MKIQDLPYYVKFVFLCGDTSYSTADINQMAYIKNADTLKRVYSLSIGDRILFEPENEIVYQITNVSIKQILEDTKDMLLGVDLEDTETMQGQPKEWLLKVLVEMEKE